MSCHVDSFSGTAEKFFVLSVCGASVVDVFGWDRASIARFPAAVADIGSLVQPRAAFTLEPAAYLIALVTGPAFLVTNNYLLTNIGFSAVKAMDTKVVGIIETPLVPGVLDPVKPDLFGDRCRVFAQVFCDLLEAGLLVEGTFNKHTVVEG
jgi:hypothetical protein